MVRLAMFAGDLDLFLSDPGSFSLTGRIWEAVGTQSECDQKRVFGNWETNACAHLGTARFGDPLHNL